ncbi:MAG: DNA polymerase III subunit delta' [Thiomicrospira sp.]
MIYPWQSAVWQRWLSQRGRYGHAYLLSGSAGLGLSECAREMAKSLFCEQQNAPCAKCVGCVQFEHHTHPDFVALAVEEGKKEIGVLQVRQLTERLMQTAHQGGYKVALIPQAEQLNASAFNALLKTLEEPPANTVLILTTYHLSRLPATLVSRCQKMAFYVPESTQSQHWLAQHKPDLDEALIKRALRLNWGAPLAALAWLEAQAWSEDQQWQADIQALSQGTQTFSQIVQKWLKWAQPQVVFNQFYLTSVNEIRRAAYQGTPVNTAWFHFQQQVLQAQADWSNNGNKELVLESLCWLFLQVIEQKASLPMVFSGTEIRGDWA